MILVRSGRAWSTKKSMLYMQWSYRLRICLGRKFQSNESHGMAHMIQQTKVPFLSFSSPP